MTAVFYKPHEQQEYRFLPYHGARDSLLRGTTHCQRLDHCGRHCARHTSVGDHDPPDHQTPHPQEGQTRRTHRFRRAAADLSRSLCRGLLHPRSTPRRARAGTWRLRYRCAVYRGRASTVVGQHRWVCGASSPAALPSRRSNPKQQLRRHGARYHLDVHGVAQLRRRVHPYSECTGPEPTTGQLDTRTGAAHDSADHGSLRM